MLGPDKRAHVLDGDSWLLSMTVYVKNSHLVGQRTLREVSCRAESETELQTHSPVVALTQFDLYFQFHFVF